jgi:GNAT superfamily N-acetyltransferase
VSRVIELLDATHDREGFDCGSEPLNRFLQQVARQHNERGVARTFVMVEADARTPKPILGFFSLSAFEVTGAVLPPGLAKKLPRAIPAARLGRLAVAKAMQGQRIGSVLMYAALKKVAQIADSIGIAALFVDAKDDDAARFYGRFQFVPLPDHPLTLFLPLRTLMDAVRE